MTMSASSQPDPCVIVLAYAHRSGHIDYEEMTFWAADLGIERRELMNVFGSDSFEEDNFARRAERRSPLAAGPQAREVVLSTLATAYAHGRIEFNDLLAWAEELALGRGEVTALIRLAGKLAYGPGRRRPYGVAVAE
jgi:hypothetical protein